METGHKKGDHVRYGTNGVCVIADIESIPSMDRRSIKTYYVLRPVAESSTKIFIPLDIPRREVAAYIHAIWEETSPKSCHPALWECLQHAPEGLFPLFLDISV